VPTICLRFTTLQPTKTEKVFWAILPGLDKLSYDREIGLIGIDEPKLEEFLEKSLNRRANVEKIGTITSKRSCLQDGILFICKILLPNVVS
jgi:hypothetical protein